MKYRLVIATIIIGIFTGSCDLNLNAPDNGNNGSNPDTTSLYRNATSSHLADQLTGTSAKAKAGDLDNDGDLEIVVASELEANKVLINNGSGEFTDESSSRLPAQQYDSQDLIIADLNNDGNQDLFFVGDQNETNELYINDGRGSFSDLTNRIPFSGTSTSVAANDVDGDGTTDILIGNLGQNVLLMNSGNAFFNNQTNERLPQISDGTRDIVFGDITGNNLRDIIIGNEDVNRIWINTGSGFFTDQTTNRIPFINDLEETYDVDIADIDGDGDRDLYFGNTGFQNEANPQDRILINDGQGFFSDQTSDRLPTITTNTFDAEFADIDIDDDLDLIVGDYDGGIRILINDGDGFFSDQSNNWIPDDFTPRVMDLEIADFNNDELADIYTSVRDGQDQLLLQREL